MGCIPELPRPTSLADLPPLVPTRLLPVHVQHGLQLQYGHWQRLCLSLAEVHMTWQKADRCLRGPGS